MTLIAIAVSLLSNCGNFLRPHKISIQQGNIVTKSMLDKLTIGMTKRQVEYLLGTPLVVDTFQPDHWHYIYYYRLGTGEKLQRVLTVSFTDDQLSEIKGSYNYSKEDGREDVNNRKIQEEVKDKK